MKVIILGASGIIGQHLRLCIPKGIEPIWVRRNADLMHVGLDLNDFTAVFAFLQKEKPQAIINLAGENNTDEVERNPEKYRRINVELPDELAQWCRRASVHYVHVSTQAVFDGEHPPYHPTSTRNPINEYGRQKYEAEQRIAWHSSSHWTIVRPTFVLGIRPMPLVGRQNPAEQMLSAEGPQKQVCDRFFSIVFAREAAMSLWNVVRDEPQMRALHVGVTDGVSRLMLANDLDCENVESVSHSRFPSLAPRPFNTRYAETPDNPHRSIVNDMKLLRAEYFDSKSIGIHQRAKELSLFTGMEEIDCLEKLKTGFGQLHGEVAKDFRKFNPQNDDELLEWYRRTDAYLWELSAYHADKGFNYVGMCNGVAERLTAAGAERVLCLGDGIGDLTFTLRCAGIDAIYHDLADSRTAGFAEMRAYMYVGHEMFSKKLTPGWQPPDLQENSLDAVCAFDFLEHMPNVREWVETIKRALKPGGLFFAQNAFACGSGPNGSIPMHLAVNDHYEKDWDPMLEEIGFKQESSNWYIAPEHEPALT